MRALNVHYPLPQTAAAPRDNPQSIEKVELGRLLFYDPILSGDLDVACATCHHPNNGYAEYRDLSIGVNGSGFGINRTFNSPNTIPFVKRNAHTILNTAFNGLNITNNYDPENAPMFWDNRVKSLEAQAIEPILAFEEMRGTKYDEEEIIIEVISRLKKNKTYATIFKQVFRDEESITRENIGKALAAFERTLVTTNSRFDQFMRGDKDAISLSEKEGFEIFKEVGCGNCHNGAMFSDFKSHVLGVPENLKLSEFDKGIEERYAFRTPSLRNLRFTAPYMHNGIFNTLEEVLEFYEDIADGKERHEEIKASHYDEFVNELQLTSREINPIISFLNCLNDDDFDKKIPESVPSGLPVGGDIGR
ncbi:hypothetical protein GCM10007940_16380 [Portibacter lacus]|uniref:Di-haem cytochrome c peroxidase domain-containing protein n=1 Tax=Portibacter lacus TaxID=1099794 RepID=A0AA37WDL3_9BACT|nr:hypothetical protein GCM10007940_16380 [Portibacter lacus]